MTVTLKVLKPETCNDCGLCCEGNGSPVVLYAANARYPSKHPHRPVGIPQELIDEIDLHFTGLFRGQESQDRCLWFDAENRVCKHYEWRPQVCHEYELSGYACLEKRRPCVT